MKEELRNDHLPKKKKKKKRRRNATDADQGRRCNGVAEERRERRRKRKKEVGGDERDKEGVTCDTASTQEASTQLLMKEEKGQKMKKKKKKTKSKTSKKSKKKRTALDAPEVHLRHRKAYVDLIVVEASDIVPPAREEGLWSSLGSIFTAKSTNDLDLYCAVSMGDLIFQTSVCPPNTVPLWNENCTFVTTVERSEFQYITLELLDRNDRRFGTDQSIAKLAIPIGALSFNQLHDLWLDLYPNSELIRCSPEATECPGHDEDADCPSSAEPSPRSSLDLSNQSTTGDSSRGGDGAPAPVELMAVPSILHPTGAASEPLLRSAQTPTARLHVMLHKVYTPAAGILRHLGAPQEHVPLRMDAGDLILVNSSYFLTHGVKLGTGSQVYRENSSMGIRRLKMERSEDMLQSLNAFIGGMARSCLGCMKTGGWRYCYEMPLFTERVEVKGRPYNMSITELMRAAYGTNESEDLNSLFCSQLVAKAYQRMGLIGEEYLSNNFLPSHFDRPDLGCGLSPSWVGPVNIIPQRVLPPPFENVDITLKRAPSHTSFETAFTGSVVHVAISDTVEVTASSGKTHTEYVIQVFLDTGQAWTVMRRYRQFATLHKQLTKRYAGIPSIPPKTINDSTKMSRETIALRQCALQAYLGILIDQPLTAQSRIVKQFLAEGAFN